MRAGRFIEGLEEIARVRGRMKRHDDRRLDRAVEKWPQAQRRQPHHQGFVVARVALQPSRLPSFGFELGYRLVQRHHHVGRRREAPLGRLFHVDILVVQVHRQGLTAARAGVQDLFSNEHEPHSRDPFKTFATCRYQGIEARSACVDLDGAERTHGVHDQALVVTLAYVGYGLQGIEYPGAGFAMDQHHVADAGVGVQAVFQGLGRNLLRFVEGQQGATPAHQTGQFGRAFAIRAVVQYQHVGVVRHQRGNRGLHAEGAASLQRHHHMGLGAVNDRQQALSHAGRDGVEVGIPRTPIAQHRQLRAQGGRERTGCQQDLVSVHGVPL